MVVFPAPFRPRITTRLPLSIARSTSVNTSSDPYDFESSAAVSGVRPHGAGAGNLIRATLSLRRSPSRPAIIFSARLSIDWAAWALVALARIRFAWSVSVFALFSVFIRSRLRRRSSVSRWSRYADQPRL